MKKCILSFILGGIFFGGIIYAYQYSAKDITYHPSNNAWKVGNVKSAIDSIKNTNDTTIANLESANSNKDLTIEELNNRLLTYKNLDKVTDFSASDLVSGKKAYTSDGEYIIGTHTEECIVSSYNKPTNSNININFGFIPSTINVYFTDSNGKKFVIYDLKHDNNFYSVNYDNMAIVNTRSSYSLNSTSLVSNFNINGDAYKSSIVVYYTACK